MSFKKNILISLIIFSTTYISQSSAYQDKIKTIKILGMSHPVESMPYIDQVCNSTDMEKVSSICNKAIMVKDDLVKHFCDLKQKNQNDFVNNCKKATQEINVVINSQEMVLKALKNSNADLVIYESENPLRVQHFIEDAKNCQKNKSFRECILHYQTFIDKWYLRFTTIYLFENTKLKEFLIKHPNLEDQIENCDKFKNFSSCKILKNYMTIHSNAINEIIRNEKKAKNILIIVGKNHLKYSTCDSIIIDQNTNCKILINEK